MGRAGERRGGVLERPVAREPIDLEAFVGETRLLVGGRAWCRRSRQPSALSWRASASAV